MAAEGKEIQDFQCVCVTETRDRNDSSKMRGKVWPTGNVCNHSNVAH